MILFIFLHRKNNISKTLLSKVKVKPRVLLYLLIHSKMFIYYSIIYIYEFVFKRVMLAPSDAIFRFRCNLPFSMQSSMYRCNLPFPMQSSISDAIIRDNFLLNFLTLTCLLIIFLIVTFLCLL